MITLTKTQQEIIESNARVRLILGGVRSGKTLTIVKILENEMKKLSPKHVKVIISEPTVAFAKEIMREIISGFKKEDMVCIMQQELPFEIHTIHGQIEVNCLSGSEEIHGNNYDIIVIDHATRNKFFTELFEKYVYGVYGINGNNSVKLIAVGHCPNPEDTKNPFYKAWCSAYFGSIKDTEAFKLRTWDNPAFADKKEEHEMKLIQRMGLERYVRDYYATII